MKKIKVPEGMLKTAQEAHCEWGQKTAPNYFGDEDLVRSGLEAALLWLSEHPQVPTDEQAAALLEIFYSHECDGKDSAKRIVVEWQRRCFVQEEPEIPSELKDLLFLGGIASGSDCLCEVRRGYLDERILEAYRRGLRKGEQK